MSLAPSGVLQRTMRDRRSYEVADTESQFQGKTEQNETNNKMESDSSSELEITNSEISSDESSFDSEASRINFWRDINTGDDEYTNAVIVSKNQSGMADTDNIF